MDYVIRVKQYLDSKLVRRRLVQIEFRKLGNIQDLGPVSRTKCFDSLTLTFISTIKKIKCIHIILFLHNGQELLSYTCK